MESPPQSSPPRSTITGRSPDQLELHRRVAKLVGLLPALLIGEDVETVHDVRVWTRRIQQSLESIIPKPYPARARAADRTLRRLRRALGAWRDDDVVLEEIRRRIRLTSSPATCAAWTFVETEVATRRDNAISQARKRILTLDFPTTTATLSRIAMDETIHRKPESANRLNIVLTAAHDAWRTALSQARNNRSTEDLHAFRISVKRLRYQAEIAVRNGETSLRPVLKHLKNQQERLGDWHDSQTLQRFAVEAFARPETLLSKAKLACIILRDLTVEIDRTTAAAEGILADAEGPIPNIIETWGTPTE